MINGYDKNGKLVYRFRYIIDLAEYFGIPEWKPIQDSFKNNRQFNHNDIIYHMEDEAILFTDFINMFNKIIETSDYPFDNDLAGFVIQTKDGVDAVTYGEESFNFEHGTRSYMFISTLDIHNGLINAAEKYERTLHKINAIKTSKGLKEEIKDDPNQLSINFENYKPKIVDPVEDNQSICYSLSIEEAKERWPDYAGQIDATIAATKAWGEKHLENLKLAPEIEEYFRVRNQKIVEMTEKKKGCDHDIDKEAEEAVVFGKKNHMDADDGGKYDEKGNSSHYQANFMEFVREQERKYGTIVAMLVCQGNVDKYSQRAGMKEGVPAAKDLTKRDWYFKAVQHFRKKIDAMKNMELEIEGRNAYVPLAEEVLDLLRAEHSTLKVLTTEYNPLAKAIEDE